MGRRLTAVLTAILAVVITSCSVISPGGGDPTTDPTTQPQGSGTMPTEIPSWLLECGDPNSKGPDDPSADATDGTVPENFQLADLDLTQATWPMPDGFQQTFAYSEDNPVEGQPTSNWIAEPVNPTMPMLNVLSVVIYTGIDWDDLADGCGRVPWSAVEEKLARYRDMIGANPLTDVSTSEISGQPVLVQDIDLARYDYTGYWLFSETQLLHLYCQWTDPQYEPTIRAGCQTLAQTISVPGS